MGDMQDFGMKAGQPYLMHQDPGQAGWKQGYSSNQPHSSTCNPKVILNAIRQGMTYLLAALPGTI